MKNSFFKTKNLLLASVLALSYSCSTEESLEIQQLEGVSNTSTQLNSIIQAEDFDNQSGVQVVNNSRVGFIEDGDWIRFDDFDYDGANSISIQAGTRTGGGTIEIRTGSPTRGDLLGTVDITSTGGFDDFETFTASINDNSSNSDLYLTFTGGSGFLLDIDSFTINSGSAPSTPSRNNDDDSNIALNGTATQSSTAFGGSASRAIDGNTAGNFGSNSVTHTNTTAQPWWQVDLGNNQTIEDIVIWNRTDNCCVSRLSNFNVTVLDSSGNVEFSQTISNAPTPSVTISAGGVSGNRVRVQLNGTNPLSLAEVQIFGSSTTVAPEVDTPTTGSGDFGLNPNLEPWENFDLSDWALDTPVPRPSDECRALRIGEDEWDEIPGSDVRPHFFTHTDGGMRFVSPVEGVTTNRNCDEGFPRSELRENLRAGDRSISETGDNANNWALGYQPSNSAHGGRNGRLTATLRVNRVTTTGDGLHPGRTIIGQIHASDDEPARLYYRKCPDAEFGSIYLEHEINGGDDVTFNMIGSERCEDNGPDEGIRLNELFSYEIINEGAIITVNIIRGDADQPIIATAIVNMEELDSGYDERDEWMYFKAGAYTQNRTGDEGDTDVMTFYRLSNSHDSN